MTQLTLTLIKRKIIRFVTLLGRMSVSPRNRGPKIEFYTRRILLYDFYYEFFIHHGN